MPFKVNSSPTHNGKKAYFKVNNNYTALCFTHLVPQKTTLLYTSSAYKITASTSCQRKRQHELYELCCSWSSHTYRIFSQDILKRCWGRSVTYICVIGSSKFPSITILHIGYNGCICLNIQGSTCYRLKKQPKDIQPRTSSTTNITLAKLSSRLLCLSGWQRWVLAKLLGL